MKTINALIAPPGAGKTTWLINHLKLKKNEYSIIAFPTKLLSAEVQGRLTDISLTYNAIDSDNTEGSVAQCLEATLLLKKDKIVICTHESLRLINADTLQGWHLYIDEIPTTWDCDTLSFSELSYRAALDQYAEIDEKHNHRLKIKADCKQLAKDLASQSTSALSKEARKLLKALLDDRYIIEVDQLDAKQIRTVRIVGVKHYIPVFEATESTVIMGAEIEKTLLGVILKGAGWRVKSIETSLDFKGYGNKVIIHPFLAANQTYSKRSALVKNGKFEEHYEEGCILDDWLKHDVFKIIGNRKAILVAHSWCNPTLPIIEDGQSTNIAKPSIDSRGINLYDNYNIAICLQHGNLTPVESSRSTPALAASLSLEHPINNNDILSAIKYERFYESTLQSVCRTALRSRNNGEDILLFVQDHDIAKFLCSKIGDCTIDTSHSVHVTKEDSEAKTNRDKLKLKAITLNDLGHGTTYISEQIGRSERTIRNWLKAYFQLKALQTNQAGN